MDGWGLQAWGTDGWGAIDETGGLEATSLSPPAGSTITDTTPVVVDITTLAGLTALLWVEYPHLAVVEMVYDGTGLEPLFWNPPSTVVDLGDGRRFTILRTPRWPDTEVRLHVYATDGGGNVINQVLSWTVTPTFQAVTVPATVHLATKVERFGVGLAHPFRLGPSSDFMRVAGPDLVNGKVRQVQGTRRGEVRWRPGFGASLDTLRHRSNTRALDELARIQVERALGRWVPEIRVLGTVVDPISDGTANQLVLSTAYQVGNAQPEAAQTVV